MPHAYRQKRMASRKEIGIVEKFLERLQHRPRRTLEGIIVTLILLVFVATTSIISSCERSQEVAEILPDNILAPSSIPNHNSIEMPQLMPSQDSAEIPTTVPSHSADSIWTTPPSPLVIEFIESNPTLRALFEDTLFYYHFSESP